MARQNEIAITTRDGAVSGSFRRGRQGCHLAHDRAWRLRQRVDHTYGLRYAPGDLFLRPTARAFSGAPGEGILAGSRRFSERSTVSGRAAGAAGIDRTRCRCSERRGKGKGQELRSQTLSPSPIPAPDRLPRLRDKVVK